MHDLASPDPSRLLEALIPAVREAGRFIEEVKARGIVELTKADDSPVTEADRGAEQILRAAIRALEPGAVIVGEEGVAEGDIPEPGPRFWLLDPLDGTRDFIAGRDGYTVNAGLIMDGAPALGFVLHPPTGQLWAGGPGLGAWFEGRAGARLQLATRRLAEPPLLMLSHSHLDERTRAWADAVPAAISTTAGSSIKFCRLAAGEADAYPRYGMTFEWDTAAADAVLRGAGGMTFAPGGQLFSYGKEGYRNGPFLALGDPSSAAALPPF
jgi:3'(2'), 5'-bisphosphate nucleotidase